MFLQWELWKACTNGCKFCFNRNQQDWDKLDRIKQVREQIVKLNNAVTDIGLIGGEFFDGQLLDVSAEFFSLADYICSLLAQSKLKRFLITTSLMYQDRSDLETFLAIVDQHNVANKVLICTSWDVAYRFNEHTLQNWHNNMTWLRANSKVMTHVQMIMTGCFVKAALDMFSLQDFIKQYKTTVDFIQPSTGWYYISKEQMQKELPNFFPERQQFLELLSLWSEQDVDIAGLLDMTKHANTVDLMLHGKNITFEDRHEKEKYHCQKQTPANVGYIDSNVPMRQDVETFCF